MEEITLVLCGPHETRDRWSPMGHRISRGIRVAQATGSHLVVSGDSFGGRDVEHFVSLAHAAGIPAAGLYNDGGRTLTDVREFLRAVSLHERFAFARRVRLVTDAWHMDRALCYFHGEAERLFAADRVLAVVAEPVEDGPPVSETVLVNERRGIEDYLRCPGEYRPRGEPFGKPSHGRAEATGFQLTSST